MPSEERRFVVGATYRRRDLHALVGGQQQGGISTPKREPLILLFTGESGHQYGYSDRFMPDGTFRYTGEGQTGDMKMAGGNLAIRDHAARGKTLHLFTLIKPSGTVQYMGEASYIAHELATAPDKMGLPRQVILFVLALEPGNRSGRPTVLSKHLQKNPAPLWEMPLSALRKRCLLKSPGNAPARERLAAVRVRSRSIHVYALRRAEGKCEACGSDAPFKTPVGEPFLEVHHLLRLADEGPDHPRWVAAICPNCHRRVHCGEDGSAFNITIANVIGRLEVDQDA